MGSTGQGMGCAAVDQAASRFGQRLEEDRMLGGTFRELDIYLSGLEEQREAHGEAGAEINQ